MSSGFDAFSVGFVPCLQPAAGADQLKKLLPMMPRDPVQLALKLIGSPYLWSPMRESEFRACFWPEIVSKFYRLRLFDL